MPSFFERLHELRDTSGETQQHIAEQLGITPQAFSYYINGREPNFDMLCKMAEYFHVTTDYLLGRSEYQTEHSEKIGGTTGISEAAANALSLLLRSNASEVNALISSDAFSSLVKATRLYAQNAANFDNTLSEVYVDADRRYFEFVESAERKLHAKLENQIHNFWYAYASVAQRAEKIRHASDAAPIKEAINENINRLASLQANKHGLENQERLLSASKAEIEKTLAVFDGLKLPKGSAEAETIRRTISENSARLLMISEELQRCRGEHQKADSEITELEQEIRFDTEKIQKIRSEAK